MRRGWLVRIAALVALLWGCSLIAGCEHEDDGTTPVAEQGLPELHLTDATPDVLFTWVDDQGGTHTAVTVAEIPDSGRKQVRVVTPSAGNGSTFYVADLSHKADDGSYSVSSMSRAAWEKLIEERRVAYRHAHAPPAVSVDGHDVPGLPDAAPEAIVYGASWCKPCDAATHYLESRGVHVKKVDVEKEPRYAREMQDKLRKAGKPGGSIPVIDIGGIILQGYSRGALDAALAKLKRGNL